jgi:hypothetical protein
VAWWSSTRKSVIISISIGSLRSKSRVREKPTFKLARELEHTGQMFIRVNESGVPVPTEIELATFGEWISFLQNEDRRLDRGSARTR